MNESEIRSKLNPELLPHLANAMFEQIITLVWNLPQPIIEFGPQYLDGILVQHLYNFGPIDRSTKNSEVTESTGFVYVLRETITKNISVIGRAKDIDSRLNWYGKTLPYDLELVGLIHSEDYVQLEKQLHKMFEAKHVRGEWFNLSEADLAELAFLDGWTV